MVRVRPANLADADEVIRINVRTWQQAYAGIVPDDVLAALDGRIDERVRQARERWSSPEPRQYHTLVACPEPDAGRRPIGFATYGPYREDQDPEHPDPAVGEVLAIYVDPAHQGRGAGRALMDGAVAALRAAGAGEVRLWVLEDNAPSRRFYERYGFVADGARDTFRVTRPDGTPVDLDEVRYALRPAAA